MLGRIYYLSSRNMRQIPSRYAAALPRQIPGVNVPAAASLSTARAFSTTTMNEAEPKVDALKDRLVQATIKAEKKQAMLPKIDESSFRTKPTTPEEHKFVNDCFEMFDLNRNGVIEMWEINAVYESGSGSAVGACFIESGLAGEVRNSGLQRGKSVGALEETVYTYGVDFTSNAQVLKAMDLVRAVKKGRVNVAGDQQFDRFVTQEEFTRWAMRLVELHNASQLETAAIIDEARPDVQDFVNESLRM